MAYLWMLLVVLPASYHDFHRRGRREVSHVASLSSQALMAQLMTMIHWREMHTTSFQYVSNLFVLVQMLLKERLQLLLIVW